MQKGKVRVYTDLFEASHGRKPRGRGSWGFAPQRYPRSPEIIWTSGTYSEARKKAIEVASRAGLHALYVLP